MPGPTYLVCSDCIRRSLAVISVATFLLIQSFPSLRRRRLPVNMSAFFSWGFGKLQPFTFLVISLPQAGAAGLFSNVLLANLPQFLLSTVYMLSNTVLSTFLVQLEFSRMCQEHRRKPLRVSEPIGIQRGSYFISLPLRYGVPLYVTSSVLHWTISESLFLAKITSVKADGSPDPANSFSACAYSLIAIFTCKTLPVLS